MTWGGTANNSRELLQVIPFPVLSSLRLVIALRHPNHYPHFAYEETEAGRGATTRSRVGNWWSWDSNPSSQNQTANPESTMSQATQCADHTGSPTQGWLALLSCGGIKVVSSCLWGGDSILWARGGGTFDDKTGLLIQLAGVPAGERGL